MCRSISPASFLAIVFNKRRSASIAYSDLEACRQKMVGMRAGLNESYDVDWNHDSFLFTLGFYAPVFQDEGADMKCDLEALDKYFSVITSDIPPEDVERLESAFA